MQAEPLPAPASEAEPGTITTFYSYKGGTGRTMALANCACVLAERLAPGERLLVVDWDLEAPGLHRYFPPRLRGNHPAQDSGLDAGLGLIDLFGALSELLPEQPAADMAQSAAEVDRAIAEVNWAAFIGQTEFPAIDILRAGRNDDGGYARRVNTFAWERLFQRAPGIYRAFAERLARAYRWVLIDSRTGVTDISGICTSLLPEKLVVVFTPNRQSLTGVRELVQTATAYRRGHDDLRPLLVLPLPSRIEASMEKLRLHWRHGRPEDGIVGYQPMFEDLLAECYDLADCDLGPYFDAVQIQQTPDCAYGEVISVRSGSSDRFSLASSYRVFVDRLMAPTPPWEPLHAQAAAPGREPPKPVGGESPQATPAVPADLEPVTLPLGSQAADLFAPGSRPPPAGMSAPQARRQRVFLSYASEDRQRVDQVSGLLRARGFEVFDQKELQFGSRWDDQIAEALDGADAVVVFWSHSAVASESVRVEAEEGLRRGVLLPVLLDEARPPLSFRGVQAADLRRNFDGQLLSLVDDIGRIARASPGDRTMLGPASHHPPAATLPAPPTLSPPWSGPAPSTAAAPPAPAGAAGAGRGPAGWLLAAVLAVATGLGLWWWLAQPAGEGGPPTAVPNGSVQTPVVAPRLVSVPDLQDRATSVAVEVASSLRLRLVAVDERGQQHEPPPDGLVLSQSPLPGTQVAEGTVVMLVVATQTAPVPSVGGLSLGDALARLRSTGLDLGAVESVEGSGVKAGTVVRQLPQAGTVVPLGSKVGVGVAAEPRPARQGVPPPSPARPVQGVPPALR